MIVTLFLTIIYGLVWLLTAPFRLFSNVSAESGVGAAITNSTHYLASVNNFVPVDTLATVLGLVLAIEIILALYKLTMWVIRRLPTQA